MALTRFRRLKVSAIAAAFAFASAGVAFAQGGGQSSGNGSPSAGKPAAAAQESTGKSPSDSGSQAGGQSGQSGQPGTDRQSRSSAASSARVRNQESTFDRWLSTSREGARLERVRDRLMVAVSDALAAGVPLEAFTARIQEAAAKGASPDTVAAAIELDAARWRWLAGLLDGGSWPPTASAPGFYLAAGAAFRNGLGEEAIGDVVVWAKAARATAEKAGAALTGAAAISTAFGASDAAMGATARILANSRLKPGQYDAVAALAARAAAAGIAPARFLEALEATIGSGRQLADLERALFG